MGLKYGVTPLENLKSFKARTWYHEGFVKCATRIAADYVGRNEVLKGGAVSSGSGEDDNGAINVNLTQMFCVLNGRVMGSINAQTNRDLFSTGETHIANPIYSDGSDAASASITTDETAYATLIVCNSDGSGSVVAGDDDSAAAGGDGGQARYLVVLAGTGTGDYDDDHLTSAEIQSALDATEDESVDHSGTTGWAHVAQIEWADASGTVSLSTTMNRNNVSSEA